MPDPDNWHRQPGAASSGRVVIFDLDGVIADATHRQRYLRGNDKDWRGFFTASADDPPIPTGRALAGSVTGGHTIVILTARPAYTAEATVQWLADRHVRHDLLILRPPDDRRPSAQFKRDELGRLREAGYDVVLAIDDDEYIVAMYREEGVFALYVHSGYYER